MAESFVTDPLSTSFEPRSATYAFFIMPPCTEEAPPSSALPEVASVDALDASGTRWRVTFAAALLESPALSCVGTYELVGASGHRPAVLAATPEAGATPSYVDLETAEHTAEASYTLTLHFLEVA